MSAIFAQRLTRTCFRRRNFAACPRDVKKSAYNGLVCQILEYCSFYGSIPPQDELQKVQKGAARFVTGNYTYETGVVTCILEQLKFESLKKRRKDRRLIMVYKGLKGAAVYPQMTLFPQSGVPGIITSWHSKPHWL